MCQLHTLLLINPMSQIQDVSSLHSYFYLEKMYLHRSPNFNRSPVYCEYFLNNKLFVKYNSFCQIENEALWIELSKQFKLDNLVTLCILLNKGCWWMFRLLNKYLTLVTTPCKKGFESWTKQNLFKNLFYNNPSIYI